MSDKMREEFQEAYADYCAERGWKTYTAFHMLSEVYVKASTELAWNMWKASRESLVIELPDDGIEDCRKEWPERGEKYEYDTFDTGYLFSCMKHEQAIEAAGLKVKS